MTSSGGNWVAVPIPGAPDRWDWVPDEQPPSPDGSAGRWHVVGGTDTRAGQWEWHPAAAAPPPPPQSWAPAPAPTGTAPASSGPAPANEPAPPAGAGAEGSAPWMGGTPVPPPPMGGAAGWHSAPAALPVELSKPRRSLKVPIAIVSALVAIAVIGVVLLLVLSGGDDGKNKKDISALATYVVTVDSGKDVCSTHLTASFVQNMFGSMDACEKDDDSSSNGESGNATGANVTNIKLSGDTATATVAVLGGDTDGATGTWAFAKDDKGVWRVDDWRVDYLRSSFQKGFGAHYTPSDDDDPFTDASLRSCVTDQALKLDDTAFLNFAHQQFRNSDDATKQMLTFMGNCPSDTAGVSALRALFEKGFRASVGTSLSSDTTDCIVMGMRTGLSDDDIKDLSVNSDQPHPDIQSRIQQITIGCAGSNGSATTPDVPVPNLDDPGFGT